MREIVYDVAMTLDGYICHADGSADGFVPEGDHVVAYQSRLSGYDTVIMGRKTYEFGYQFGLKPGTRAYPHMRHLIFSDQLELDGSEVEVLPQREIHQIQQLKGSDGGSIYLCGGGTFAGHLLDVGWIDRLIVKLNPVVFGSGIRLFGESTSTANWRLVKSTSHQSGVTTIEYQLEPE